MEHQEAQFIDVKKDFQVSEPVGKVQLEIHINLSCLQELLADYNRKIKLATLVEQVNECDRLSDYWINRLRHQHTNYEVLLQVSRNTGFRHGEFYEQIKAEFNKQLNDAWTLRIHTRLKPLIHERLEHIAKQEAIERRQKEHLLEREAHIREEFGNTVYVLTKTEVGRLLPKQSYSPKYAWDGSANSVKVIQTFALCDVYAKVFMYAVVSEPCYWLDFDDTGCMEYTVNHSEVFTIQSLTVTKHDSPLAMSLMQKTEIGDVVTVAKKEMIVVNISGGRVSNLLDWNSLRRDYEEKQAERRVKRQTEDDLARRRIAQEHEAAVRQQAKAQPTAVATSGGGCIVTLVLFPISLILATKLLLWAFPLVAAYCFHG